MWSCHRRDRSRRAWRSGASQGLSRGWGEWEQSGPAEPARWWSARAGAQAVGSQGMSHSNHGGWPKHPALHGGVLAGSPSDLISTLSPEITCQGTWLASSSAVSPAPICVSVTASSNLPVFCGIPEGINLQVRKPCPAPAHITPLGFCHLLSPISENPSCELRWSIGLSLLTCDGTINNPLRN